MMIIKKKLTIVICVLLFCLAVGFRDSLLPEPLVEIPPPKYVACDLSGLDRVSNYDPLTVSDALHKIRLERYFEIGAGVDYVFLLDSVEFASAFQGSQFPIYKNGFGEWVVAEKNFAFRHGEKHPDQLLSALIESGLPLTAKINVDGDEVSLADLLHSSRVMCVLQQEMEWTCLANLLVESESPDWSNRFGDKISIRDLVESLLTRHRSEYSCSGTHVLYVLTRALERHNSSSFLSRSQVKRIKATLREASCRLPDII